MPKRLQFSLFIFTTNTDNKNDQTTINFLKPNNATIDLDKVKNNIEEHFLPYVVCAYFCISQKIDSFPQ
jgi:hypothetical protein